MGFSELTERYTKLEGIGVDCPAGSIGDETVWCPVEATLVKVKVTLPSTLDGPITRETSMYPSRETPRVFTMDENARRSDMAVKSRKRAVEVGDRVYFDNDKNDTGTVKEIRWGVPRDGGENFHPHWIALVQWDKNAYTGKEPGELMEVQAALTHPSDKRKGEAE